MSITKARSRAGALLLAISWAWPVAAADDPSMGADFFASPVTDDVLSGQRGREWVGMSTQTLESLVNNNSATNTVNGANLITGGSFANAAGLATAIQNSGNNVSIQNATILQIQLR